MELTGATIVIFDSDCHLCRVSVDWIKIYTPIIALGFATTNLESFGLTREQCEREVWVIDEGRKYSGASAVAHLLQLRGNLRLARFIKLSGLFGRIGYRWVAKNRGSAIVRILVKLLERDISRN